MLSIGFWMVLPEESCFTNPGSITVRKLSLHKGDVGHASKILIGNSEFYSDFASHARKSIELATKPAMLLEEGNVNLKALNCLRKVLFESHDSFNSLAALVLESDTLLYDT